MRLRAPLECGCFACRARDQHDGPGHGGFREGRSRRHSRCAADSRSHRPGLPVGAHAPTGARSRCNDSEPGASSDNPRERLPMHDIVIRGGTIMDGTGKAGFTGDVAISEGRIAAVGGKQGPGKREIDADGQLVTPGWVDVHTHYGRPGDVGFRCSRRRRGTASPRRCSATAVSASPRSRRSTAAR